MTQTMAPDIYTDNMSETFSIHDHVCAWDVYIGPLLPNGYFFTASR